MEIVLNEKYTIWGKVEIVNKSTHDTFAVSCVDIDKGKVTVRVPQGTILHLNKIYRFECIGFDFKEKLTLLSNDIKIIDDIKLTDDRREELFKSFYNYAPINVSETKAYIEDKLKNISNKCIKDITSAIYKKNIDNFYLYPAATKFHHAYISGLAYHTVTIMKLIDGIANTYPFLNKDLLYAGALLHDMCKIMEFTSYEGPEYSTKGKLIGHITLGAIEIARTADKLKYTEFEEAMLLEHMIITHHYYGNFGSPKKPNIPEALILHFLDNIDSKMCVLGEQLDLVDIGEFTGMVNVIDREKFYKHKLYKK